MKVKINGVIRNLRPLNGSEETLEKFKTKVNKKPVIFKGEEYPSLTSCRVQNGLSGRNIKTLRERGEIKYL